MKHFDGKNGNNLATAEGLGGLGQIGVQVQQSLSFYMRRPKTCTSYLFNKLQPYKNNIIHLLLLICDYCLIYKLKYN